ncbi:MAG: NrdJb [Gammaproteobacteria bacterium]|nr:NrdJb [Gammaproteobacteria bacterium]
MARITIGKRIVKYRVQKPEAERSGAAPARDPRARKDKDTTGKVVWMHEKLERPEVLIGSTYKIKTPVSDHAMYLTINDIVLNEGTEHEHRRPFEIFINSKNLDHFQWIVALTRIISAVFRKGGDVAFLTEELKAVFDPRGGYWQPGGKFMPSLVAEIGYVVERHLQSIGLMPAAEMDAARRQLIESKRSEWEQRHRQQDAFARSSYPEGAQLCGKCHTAAVVMMDGCMTCLACGDSKCG